jgi:hypothetical protein
VAHLLALTVDSIIGLNGGLKQLLALSTNLKLSSKVQNPSVYYAEFSKVAIPYFDCNHAA